MGGIGWRGEEKKERGRRRKVEVCGGIGDVADSLSMDRSHSLILLFILFVFSM